MCPQVIKIGLPKLFHTLQKQAVEALTSRVQFHFHWEAIEDLPHFKELLLSAFQLAGAQNNDRKRSVQDPDYSLGTQRSITIRKPYHYSLSPSGSWSKFESSAG